MGQAKEEKINIQRLLQQIIGIASMVRVAVGDVTLVEESANSAAVKVTITATDKVDDVEQDTCHTITW